MYQFIIIFSFVLVSTVAHAAGFDCTKAATLVEKAVCSESDLSALDEQLMAEYKEALSAAPNAASLKNDQKSWLINTRNKCRDSVCLKRVYTERIAVLVRISGTAVPGASNVKADVSWAGTWNRTGGTSHTESCLEITEKTSHDFEFTINAANGANMGEISGPASFAKDYASYKDTEFGCKVEFRRVGKCIEIDTSEECGSFGGVGVYFGGILFQLRFL